MPSAALTLTGLQTTVEASKSVSVRLLTSRFGDGYNARRLDGINPVKEMLRIKTKFDTYTNTASIETALIGLNGNHFQWTPPFESTAKYWIVEPSQWQWQFEGELSCLTFQIERFYSPN